MAFLRLNLLSLIIFSSCDYNEPKPPSREEMVAGTDRFGKTYQINKIEVELGELKPKRCITDNYITYFPNGSYEINEGATKCNPSDDPALSGTWSLINDRILVITFRDSVQNWDIESMTEGHHIISSDFKEGSRTYTLGSSN